MMIGRTRVAVGPLRDLGHLDLLLAAVRGVRGVGEVAIDAFEGRRALLAVQVLHPVDLADELADAVGIPSAWCRLGVDRLEVLLEGEPEVVEGEAVDATVVLDGDDVPAPPVVKGGGWSAVFDAEAFEEPGASPWGAPARSGLAADGDRPALVGPGGRALPAGGDEDPPDAFELLELSFAHAPVATALVGRDGRWLRVNHRLRTLLGRDDDALLGRRLQDLAEPADDPEGERGAAELVAGPADRWSAERRFVRPDGSIVPARLQAAAVRGRDGRPRWFVLEMVETADIAAVRLAA